MLVSKPEAPRSSQPLATPRLRRRYWTLLTTLLALSALFAFGLLAWDNPMPVGTEGFWIIARMRATSLVVILIVAFCQAIATVSFQTATNNRIITPSIMGFESLYRANLCQRAALAIARLQTHRPQRKIELLCNLSHGYLSRLRAGDGIPGAPLVCLLALLARHPELISELEEV